MSSMRITKCDGCHVAISRGVTAQVVNVTAELPGHGGTGGRGIPDVGSPLDLCMECTVKTAAFVKAIPKP